MAWSEDLPLFARHRAKAKEVALALSSLNHVIIAAHVNPDGDAFGSVLACAEMLSALHKDFVLYSSTGIPEFLSFFPNPYPVHENLHDLPFKPEACLLVDLGEFHRIGGDLEELANTLLRVNVDHHQGAGLGSLANWVEPKAAATCELLACVAHSLAIPFTPTLAKSLALGLITDTGSFAYSNTTAEIMDLMAFLMRKGVDLAGLRSDLEDNMRLERMYLWANLLPKTRFLADGKIAIVLASLSDLALVQARREDLEGLVEYLRKLRGVRVSCVVREDEGKSCKFSLRSAFDLDVCTLAQSLHGGGHRNAAGGTLSLPLDEAYLKLEEALLSLPV